MEKGELTDLHREQKLLPYALFDRNPNTGARFGATREVRVAEQTIVHDADHPSHILLPVIPARTR